MGVAFSIAPMAEDDQTPDSIESADSGEAAGPESPEASDGGLLRLAALITLLAVIVAAVLIVRSGSEDPKPQSIIPVNPDPKSLDKAGFVQEDDGRFAPAGFGMTFDYPDRYFEMISPEGESSRDDETLGIAERRRHFIFPDVAKTTTSATEAQPAFRVIRVKYEEPFDTKKIEEFRANLITQPGDKPSAIEQIGGVPAFTRTYEAPGGSGSTTYFSANGMLYQLISFASRNDSRTVERDLDAILKSVDFTG